jgi:hypothetical protein
MPDNGSMCGRVILTSTIEAIAAHFHILDPARHLKHDLGPSYNVTLVRTN